MTLADLRSLPPTLSVEQAGEILGLGRSAAYAAVRRGDVQAISIGRRVIVPTAPLLALLGVSREELSAEDEHETPDSPLSEAESAGPSPDRRSGDE